MIEALRKPLLWLAALLLGIFMLGMVFRNPMLREVINMKVNSFNASYNADLKISQARFQGVSTIFLKGFSLKPLNGDSLLRIDTLIVSINAWKLLAGRLNITSIVMHRLFLNVNRHDSSTNYDFLIRPGSGFRDAGSRMRDPESVSRKKEAEDKKSRVDYSETAKNIFRWVFDRIPWETDIRDIDIRSKTDLHVVSAQLDRLAVRDRAFSTNLWITEDSTVSHWKVDGIIDNSRRFVEATLSSADKNKIKFPYIGFKWNAGLSFDTLKFSLSAGSYGKGDAGLRGVFAFKGLQVYHKRIALDTISINRLGMEYGINFLPDAIELDESTLVTFNDLEFHPYVKYRPAPSAQLTISLHKPAFPAQQLFSSLPEGLFSNLQGIRTSGELSFDLDFFVDVAAPTDLTFEMDLKRLQFRVLSYGNGALLKLDSSFLYTAYEDDKPVRSFEVGPGNPDFRKLSQISPYLQYAVMTSEDGGFYQHRGFLPDAFRESIATNIQEGRFVRGGSTISMQLVKNVFLSRKKTITRKLEEALIVWLIENQQLCSKDRMFEVYLNIIEWGPMIYGANEASRFYFNKDASDLTLAEAIFMASVIPRPKAYRFTFDENNHIRVSMSEFYRLVSEKMLTKGWITQKDFDQLQPEVELKGQAKGRRQDK